MTISRLLFVCRESRYRDSRSFHQKTNFTTDSKSKCSRDTSVNKDDYKLHISVEKRTANT